MNESKNRAIAVAAWYLLVTMAAMVVSICLGTGANAQVFEDDSTQMKFNAVNVHVCPNAVMIGVDASHNRFLCDSLSGAKLNSPTVDTSTHKDFTYDNRTVSVHVCPDNNVMVGWSQNKNWLICTQIPPAGYQLAAPIGVVVNGPPGTQFPEPKHPSHALHACTSNNPLTQWTMSGIKADENALICSSVLIMP
jgi:hypothetical protein